MPGRRKARWYLVAISYECITCGAAPDSPCITTGGHSTWTPHSTRTNLASANNWQSAETVWYAEYDSDTQTSKDTT